MNDQPVLRDIQPTHTAGLQDESEIFQAMTRGTFDLRYIAAAIRSNLVLIGAIILVSLGLALVITLLDTPRYTANATIQINDSSDRVIGENDDQTAQQSNLYDVDRFLKTQTDILKSRGLAQRVAQKLKLQGRADFYEAMEAKAPEPEVPAAQARNEIVKLLQKNLRVTLPRDSRIVTIAFESASQDISTEVANAFASEFIQANLQRKFDSSSYAREFVANQMAEAKQRVEQAERDLNEYARSNALIRTGDAAGEDTGTGVRGGSVVSASLIQLNEAANQATAARIAAAGRWQAIAAVPLLSSREVLANASVSSLMTQRATAQAELQSELSKHLEDYPTVREKRAELNRLDAELQYAAQSVRNSIRAELLAATGTEQALLARLDGLKAETLREQDKTVKYGLLKREADTNRTLYDGLLKRYNELNATAGISSSNVSIIDTAERPTLPTSPNLIMNLLIALVASLALAALTLFIKEQIDDSIRVPEDVETKLHLPLIGLVPKASSRDPDGEMADPKSPLSEAYNSLRAALLYSTSAGLPQVMLVTSAQAGEGKTTTSFATAASLARMGRKVALIDADLRRPSVHRRFNLSNERGLADLLTSNAAVASVTLPTPTENLFVIASGPIPPSPTELISSPRMEQVLQDLARDYDVVVIDSPPILGLADAPALSALADGVIFVVESDRNRRGSLKTALRRLRSMRPILLGAVLTKFDPVRSGNGYSAYYGYDYYSYEQDGREPV